jgi:NADH-quinone oxidoreductase subunit M
MTPMQDYSFLIPMMLLVPLLGGIGLTVLPKGNEKSIPQAALFYTLVTAAISGVLAYEFDWVNPQQTQFLRGAAWVESFGIDFRFGVDSISLWLVLLTTLLMPLVVLGSSSAVKERLKEFYLWLLVLESAMIGCFVATDLIFFYICFEFTLVPLYFLIGVFGSTQRLKAARVFFLYTFTGSMLTLVGVLYIAWFNHQHTGEWSFWIPQLYAAGQAMPHKQQTLVLLALLAGFAVKVPLFPLHTWLPLAHTEAPTAGSVVLAGVLLKLGTYGLLRFALPMTPAATAQLAPWIGTLAVIGILYTALICWVQKDIKKLIAYSSVSHLGFCVLGMFALNGAGVSGSILYMINHGLSTGALFLCVGMIYERFHTREISQYGGMARTMPIWAAFMVFFCLSCVVIPGLNGFVGEFLTLLGAFTATDVLGSRYTVAAGFGMILGAIYILYMVGRVVFGPCKNPAETQSHAMETSRRSSSQQQHAHAVADLNCREITTLIPLAVGCLALGIFPNIILKSLDAPVAALIDPARHAIREQIPSIEEASSTTLILINPATLRAQYQGIDPQEPCSSLEAETNP